MVGVTAWGGPPRAHGVCPPMLSFPQDSSQIGLLKELLDLQKDMVVMLLSLLEGGVPLLSCVPPHPGCPGPLCCHGCPNVPLPYRASSLFHTTWG